MKTEYDKDVDAAYIYIREIKKGDVKKTVAIAPEVNIDVGEKDEILGIEILNVKTKKHAMKELAKI